MKSLRQIYVVDDSKIFRFTVLKLLIHVGYEGEIKEFENGKTALESIEKNVGIESKLPDLILLDINMPVMNGFQLLDAIQNIGEAANKIKVRMLSSSIDLNDEAKSREYKQVIGFFTKPLTPEVAKKLIRGDAID